LNNRLLFALWALCVVACQAPASAATPTAPAAEWLSVELVDARSGEAFGLTDFAGKVVLVETMATWCPTCIRQGQAIEALHAQLGEPEDLVSISLNVDPNEDRELLKGYVEEFGFKWRFAVAPLEVTRALGNLYSAQYLNPPLAPMLLVDREGGVHLLDFGLKDVEDLRAFVEPFLEP